MVDYSARVIASLLPWLFLPFFVLEIFHLSGTPIGLMALLGLLTLGYFSFLVLILIHELGHYVAATLAGITVRHLIVGSGTRLQFTIGDLQISLHPLPTHGFVHAELSPEFFSFFRRGFFIAGGLIAHGIFLIFVYWYLYTQWSESVPWQAYQSLYVGLAVLLFGTFLAVKNLIPGKMNREGRTSPNDGLLLQQLWIERKSLPLLRRAMEMLKQINDEFEHGNAGEAAIQLANFCRDHSDQIKSVHAMAYQAMTQLRFSTSRGLFEGIVKSKSVSPNDRVAALDGLASMVIYYGRSEWLAEAEQWIIEARVAAPDKITLDGTYGGVLVETGKLAEAEAVLRNVLTKSSSPLDRMISAAYLAKIFHSRGNRLESRSWLKKANALGLHHVMVDRIKKQITSR